MSRKRFTPEQIIGKLWEGEVALCYGRIPDLRITAETVEKGTPPDPVILDFSFIGSTQKYI